MASYSFLMFLCVAMVALTAPSAANTVNTVNLNGALVCANNGTAAVQGVTVSLVCGSNLVPRGVVLTATTSATGTVSASVNVGPRTRTAIQSALCQLLVPPQACPPIGNGVIGTTVTVSRSGNTLTVTPSSQVGPLPNLATST